MMYGMKRVAWLATLKPGAVVVVTEPTTSLEDQQSVALVDCVTYRGIIVADRAFALLTGRSKDAYELQPIAWESLLSTYPPADDDDDDEDAECPICDGLGEPCRDRIACDVDDIASDVERHRPDLQALTGEAYREQRAALRLEILCWLQREGKSTLTDATFTLAEEFIKDTNQA